MMQNPMRIVKVLYVSFVLALTSCEEKVSSDYYIDSVSNPVIILNGDWKISLNPSSEFWNDTIMDAAWKDIKVPGEVMMQGFSIKNNQAFAYKKAISIPEDYQNKNIFLQFEGVYSYAIVWVNGNKVREHNGGFTSWKCDITPYVKAGEKAWITVEVTDRKDEISYGSGYAKHQIGGILRTVSLLALPSNYPEQLKIETELDADYNNSELKIYGKLNTSSNNALLKLSLYDAENNEILLENNELQLNDETNFTISNQLLSPEKWDAEHPNLYKLKVSFFEQEKLLWQNTYDVGFREVVVDGNKLLVNGKAVKLRGACRHDVHPTLGRVSTPDYELKDVLLAKEANMNFIRTSHYPPTENFLKLCDKYGIYVEDETAVCFVGFSRIGDYQLTSATQDSIPFTDRYLSQLEEMVESHRNHPSVIIWSIGNENVFGTNFKQSYDWVKKSDDTRPVIYSYPGTAPDSIKSYDILSMHYPNVDGNLNQRGKITQSFSYKEMPVLFDEWAHVACYNSIAAIEDPNIRDFWGRSLNMMWERTFEADGGLGGAIWGMIDETFMLPDTVAGFNKWWGIKDKTVDAYKGATVGYGEWGIVDTWRRKKPEFWNTKKSYSPAKLLKTSFPDYQLGQSIEAPVYNRFDHTNFNELTIKYSYKGKTEVLKPVDIQAHDKGMLSIPVHNWEKGTLVFVEIVDINNSLIDAYTLDQGKTNTPISQNDDLKEVTIAEKDGNVTFKLENNVVLTLNKTSGLFESVEFDKGSNYFSGPYLNFRTKGVRLSTVKNSINEYGENWKLEALTYEIKNQQAIILVKGSYNDLISVTYEMIVSSNGKIEIAYKLDNLPNELIREAGVKFNMDIVVDHLSWKRNPYWSYYPSGHLSEAEAEVQLYAESQNEYRVEPEKCWELDTKSFYYSGIKNESIKNELTNIAKSTKENITEYHLISKGETYLSVIGNGDIGCRISIRKENIVLYVNNQWDYVHYFKGNYQRNIKSGSNYNGEIELKINTNVQSK